MVQRAFRLRRDCSILVYFGIGIVYIILLNIAPMIPFMLFPSHLHGPSDLSTGELIRRRGCPLSLRICHRTPPATSTPMPVQSLPWS